VAPCSTGRHRNEIDSAFAENDEPEISSGKFAVQKGEKPSSSEIWIRMRELPAEEGALRWNNTGMQQMRCLT
jgi:hypothetical protein